MKNLLKVSMLFFFALVLFSCNSSDTTNAEDTEAKAAYEKALKEADEQVQAGIDSIAPKIDEMEAELDDILDGLD